MSNLEKSNLEIVGSALMAAKRKRAALFLSEHGKGLRAVLSLFPHINSDEIFSSLAACASAEQPQEALDACMAQIIALLYNLDAAHTLYEDDMPTVSFDVGAALRWYAARLSDVAKSE
ncbi:hypothetical protein [Hyphomonas sp.]|jgi:hypothetical protein|uniref:hypothetical protein n=1 Tax=Alphaproteobacteria TaxID=28211 RepID=UPI002EBA2142|nr:hypothetical protein [Pseudomonadota bacterium]